MANSFISLKMTTSMTDIEKNIKVAINNRIDKMMDGLCTLGRNCIKIAKNLPQGGIRMQYPEPYKYLGDTKPNYTDWTSNLRKSIGWAVIKDGAEYKAEIGKVQTANEYYNELKNQYSSGIYLLIMATGESPKDGRAYAGYVQALGYDVLSSAQLEMEATAKQVIQKLING